MWQLFWQLPDFGLLPEIRFLVSVIQMFPARLNYFAEQTLEFKMTFTVLGTARQLRSVLEQRFLILMIKIPQDICCNS